MMTNRLAVFKALEPDTMYSASMIADLGVEMGLIEEKKERKNFRINITQMKNARKREMKDPEGFVDVVQQSPQPAWSGKTWKLAAGLIKEREMSEDLAEKLG